MIAKASDGVGVVSARIDPAQGQERARDDPGRAAQGEHSRAEI